MFDAWNRLVQVKDGATTVATYSYNGLNHRVKKVVGSTTTTAFFNENWQELEAKTGEETMVFVWGLRYTDDLLFRDKGSERIYSLADPNWNVVALANTSGTILERMTYNAFGRVSWHDASFGNKAVSGYSWNRTFTGQVLDNETGLMLYRNRYYHTGLGRFVTRDPIGYEAEDVSLYRYVGGSPLMQTDPYGEQAWCCITAIACGGVSVTTCAALCATSHWDDIDDTFSSCWWKCMEAITGGETLAFSAVCLAAISSCIGKKISQGTPPEDTLKVRNRKPGIEKLEKRMLEGQPWW